MNSYNKLLKAEKKVLKQFPIGVFFDNREVLSDNKAFIELHIEEEVFEDYTEVIGFFIDFIEKKLKYKVTIEKELTDCGWSEYHLVISVVDLKIK